MSAASQIVTKATTAGLLGASRLNLVVRAHDSKTLNDFLRLLPIGAKLLRIWDVTALDLTIAFVS